MKWLQNAPGPGKGPNLTSEVLGSAAEGGHLDVIRWLRSKGCPWNELTSNKAAAAGALESLEFLRRHGCPFGQASFSAASTGQIKVLEWLRRQGLLRVEPMTCAAAATGGELECLEYLKSASFPFDRNATLMAGKCSPSLCARALVTLSCPDTCALSLSLLSPLKCATGN